MIMEAPTSLAWARNSEIQHEIIPLCRLRMMRPMEKYINTPRVLWTCIMKFAYMKNCGYQMFIDGEDSNL